MREEYDFSNARKNPYVKSRKEPVTVSINADTVDYFKNLSEEAGVSYQTLINIYLADCVKNQKKLPVI